MEKSNSGNRVKIIYWRLLIKLIGDSSGASKYQIEFSINRMLLWSTVLFLNPIGVSCL